MRGEGQVRSKIQQELQRRKRRSARLDAAQAKHCEGWRTWTVYPLTDADTKLPHYLTNQAGQKYDRFRWARDGVLSVLLVIQRDGQNQYVIRDYVLARPGEDAETRRADPPAGAATSREPRRASSNAAVPPVG